jgi:hypothetical protein
VGVTSGGQNLEDTVVDGEKGNIKSTPTEIIDDNSGFTTFLAIKTVGESGSGGFVDETKDLETSDGTSILGSLTLGIIEVCKNESLDCETSRTTGNTYRQGQ